MTASLRNWENRPLFSVADVSVSTVDKLSADGEQPVRLCNYTDVYKHDTVNPGLELMDATATASEVRRFRLLVGDTVFTKDSETADDIGVPAFVDGTADDFVCGYHLAVARPKHGLAHPKYLYWWLASREAARLWEVRASGVTRVGLRQADIARFPVALPPTIEDQRAVAHFLDGETAQIDAMIEAQRDLVAALEDRRAATLEGALNDVWEHPRRRLQWLYRVSSDCNQPDLEVLSVYRDFGVIPKSSRDDNFNRTPDNVERYLVVRPNDLVVNRMKAWQGSLGVSSHLGIVSGDYEVARPSTSELLPEFAHFMLRSPRLIAEYRSRSTGIRPAQWRLYWDQMSRIDVPVPPLDVQQAQLLRVKASLSRIDVMIDASNDSIALMQERRSALISAAVTGRIDPRTGKETVPENVLEFA